MIRRVGLFFLAGGMLLVYMPVALMLLFAMGSQQQSCGPGSGSAVGGAPGPTRVVGDSLTQGAQSELQARLAQAQILGKPAMPWSWGLGQLAGTQSGVVAYLLGTNGGMSSDDVTGLLKSYPNVTFVLMTLSVPFPYEGSSNGVVTAAQRANPKRVFVADWKARVSADSSLVGPDHVHPASPAGWAAFADVVAAAVGKATTASTQAGSSPAKLTTAGPSGPAVKPPYTQAQMEAAVAKYDPQQAHVLGAIGMAESSGYQFPSVNPTGTYHGPWQFQEASFPQLDFHRLDTDLDYSAYQAAKLASTGITHQKWESWPDAAAKFLGGQPATGVAGGQLTGQTVSIGSTAQSGGSGGTGTGTDCSMSPVAFTGTNVKGPGGSVNGNWAPGVAPIVQLIAAKFHITAMTYAGHHPDEGHAADFALSQFGNDWSDGSPGHPGTGPQWQIAQWIATNLVDKGLAWYVGHHASIHDHERDAPGVWRPIASQVGPTDPTYTHMNHIHVSWPPWFGNSGGSPTSAFQPASNFSAPPTWPVPPLPAKL